MPKPTLVQSILNRPSQTYHFPPTKEYHSTKRDIIRAVSQSEAFPLAAAIPGPSTPPMTSSRSVIMSAAIGIVSSVVADNAHNRNSTSRNSMASTSSYHSGRSSQSGASQSATSQSAASQSVASQSVASQSVASRHRTMNNQDTSVSK